MRRSGRLLGLLARRVSAEASGATAGEVASAAPRYFTAAALRNPIIGGAMPGCLARGCPASVVVSLRRTQPGPSRAGIELHGCLLYRSRCPTGPAIGGSRQPGAASCRRPPRQSAVRRSSSPAVGGSESAVPPCLSTRCRGKFDWPDWLWRSRTGALGRDAAHLRAGSEAQRPVSRLCLARMRCMWDWCD